MVKTSVEKSRVAEAPSINQDLDPILNEWGRPQVEHIRLGDVLSGPLAEVNRERYTAKYACAPEDASSLESCVFCYLAKQGWVISMREEDTGVSSQSGYLLQLFNLPRVEELIEGQRGDTTLLRKTDMFCDMVTMWPAFQRILETEHGIVASAQTDDNPHGYFAQTNTVQLLEGAYLYEEKKEPGAIVLRKIGRTLITRPAEYPKENEVGLHPIHTHNMGYAECIDGEWSPTYILPSAEIGFQVVNTNALQFAQQGFEGCIAKRNRAGEICLFRIDQHAERFQQTAKSLEMSPLSRDQFVDSVVEVVRRNARYVPAYGEGSLYIRPSLKGVEGGAAVVPANRVVFTLETFPFGEFFGGPEHGIKVEALLDTARPDSGASKVGANYGTIFGVRMGVKQRGYQDYLSFDRNSFVEELSTCSVFFVEALREGGVRLVTPMVQADAENNGDSKRAADIKVLDSITRRSIIELAGALNIPVEIRDIEYHEISGFAGAFSVGTAAGLTRISRIDVKDSAEGRVCHVADYDQLEDSPAKSVINTLYDVLMRARVTELDQALHERFLSWVTKVSAE